MMTASMLLVKNIWSWKDDDAQAQAVREAFKKKKLHIFGTVPKRGGGGVYPNPNFKNISNLELYLREGVL